jgi:GAF domain-containing protein/anti-sigma regulatory factor (Ser/Thr protein kinase)
MDVMSPEPSTIGGNQSVEELRREVAEAREQQAATAEILAAISSSATDPRGIFEKIAASAARLCAAHDALIFELVGNSLRLVAHHGPIAAGPMGQGTSPLTRGRVVGRAVLDRETIHIADLQSETDQFPEGGEIARRLGHRTIVSAPLMRAGEAIGAISIRRTEVRPFTDRQIELLKIFADQAVIAIENTRLFEAEQARTKELTERTQELTEALEYQIATSDILAVISRSPSQLQPVLDTIAQTARRLCGAHHAILYRLADGAYFPAASDGIDSDYFQFLAQHPFRSARNTVVGRVALEARTIYVPDAAAEPDAVFKDAQKRAGLRTMLGVPLLRDGLVTGVIGLARIQVKPFTDKQIQLVKTFADQAVIAIENARLFEAEQASKRELQESLQQQTAAADVLKVISRSTFDLQAVLNTLVEAAARLCEADMAQISHPTRDAGHYIAASYGFSPKYIEFHKNVTFAPGRGSLTGRVLLEGKPVQIPDVLSDPEYRNSEPQRLGGYRTHLGVPLLRDGSPIGVILVSRCTVRPFDSKQIELVTTFADQAVIAIENTRLFDAEQASKRELQESLEYQTATSDVLGVISRSPNDLQPVLDTIVRTATHLCQSESAYFWRLRQGQFELLAHTGNDPKLADYMTQHPIPTGRGSIAGRAVLERRTIHLPDCLADSEYTNLEHQRIGKYRTMLGVPLLRDGVPLGVIALLRNVVKPFTQKQIELVTTFADQAVIAIENTRLLAEVQARNRDLTALGEVGRAVSSTLDLKVVLKTIVDRAVDLSGTDAGSIFYYREETETFELGESTGLDDDVILRLRRLDISGKEGGLAEAIAKRKPLQIPDLSQRPGDPLRDAVIEAGFRASLIVPLLGADGTLGTLILRRRRPGEFPTAVVSLMQSFADQSAIALENARLFDEIAHKSRELEIASQHKSQFVANMSHELRTPLAAILGYAELMQEGFYEVQGPKSLDALTRIRSNGKHLLGLINTVLDIAKIESGQFTLNMAEYAIESVVETVRSATESLAQNKKLALKTDVAKPLPVGLGDEQRLTQVLLNLVGNAIKFTDAGEVRVTAKAVNGHFNVSVADTGPGIPEQERTRIFDQFHQVDSSLTKAAGGTGLGLAIAKQIVEMHGGRIWVESTVGKGSTFQIELPTRAEFRKRAV